MSLSTREVDLESDRVYRLVIVSCLVENTTVVSILMAKPAAVAGCSQGW